MRVLFWGIYYPLLRLLGAILSLHPKYKERWDFERKNLSEAGAKSFRETSEKADLAFEFSSEGEFQQVLSLIQDALLLGKKIELVFFSPSVEKGVLELAKKHPTQIRYLRFPLVSITPKTSFSYWTTAPRLVMVRYDLFPEFLLWASNPEQSLVLLWMTFKKERVQGKHPSFLKMLFLKRAKLRVYASKEDQDMGEGLNLRGSSYDFRIEQIRRRMDKKEEKFKSAFPLYPKLQALWLNYPREKRLIFGNAWPSDLHLLKNLPSDFYLLVVPHKLEAPILEAFQRELSGSQIIDDQSQVLHGRIHILNKKGVLCELYQDFGKSYVGGGFEGSIHSVLEPFVSGSDLISCGPAHHRSTEIDLVSVSGRIRDITHAHEFEAWLSLQSPDLSFVTEADSEYLKQRQDVILC